MRTLTVAFQHAADKAAEKGNLTAISWIHVSALLLQAMRIAIPAGVNCTGADRNRHNQRRDGDTHRL